MALVELFNCPRTKAIFSEARYLGHMPQVREISLPPDEKEKRHLPISSPGSVPESPKSPGLTLVCSIHLETYIVGIPQKVVFLRVSPADGFFSGMGSGSIFLA